jgi:hypothetical protein
MKPLTRAQLALPALLGLGLLVLAIVMLIQGSTQTAVPSAAGSSPPAGPDAAGAKPKTSGVFSSEEKTPDVFTGHSSALLCLAGVLLIAALAAGACWHLNSKLQRAQHERDGALEDCTDLRQLLEQAQTENARLQAEIARKAEQLSAYKTAVQALRPAASTPRRPQPASAPGSRDPGGDLLESPSAPSGSDLKIQNSGLFDILRSDPAVESSTRRAASTPANSERPDTEALREQLQAQKALRAAESARHEQLLREKTDEIANLVQKWRDAERARFDEQEALRQEHGEALARAREQARRDQQELHAQSARRIQELEAECATLRRSLEVHLARIWPRAFLREELEGVRSAITQGMEAEPPAPEALALFGMIHHLCASADTERSRDLAFELGRTFYRWCAKTSGVFSSEEKTPDVLPVWEEQLADWLNDVLRESRLRVVIVKPGDPVSARLHSPEGSGPQVRRPLSFLVLREDGTPYKRALVAT